MKAKSMTASSHASPSIVAAPQTIASPRPGLDLGLRESLRVRAEVEELERIGRAELGVALHERSRIDELLDPLARADTEVVPALRTDAERLRELVVAVVRAAARARVRVRLALRRLVRALALDLDVDATLPGRHAVDTSAGLSEPCRCEHPRRERSVSLGREEPGDAHSGDRRPTRDVAQERLDLVRRRPVRLGDEHVDLARIEHVEVERDVGRVDACERAVERVVDARGLP